MLAVIPSPEEAPPTAAAPAAAGPGAGARVLLSLPAFLAGVTLAAHFFREGAYLFTILVLGLQLLLFVPRGFAVRTLQLTLLVGALSWVATALEIAELRRLQHQPFLRMLLILGGVALFSVVAAALLEAAPLRRWRNRRPPAAG